MLNRVFYFIALVGAILAGLYFVYAVSNANGAPQQAAGAAMAVAMAVIPYCFARACQEIGRD